MSSTWRPPPADTLGPAGGDAPPPRRAVVVLLVALVLVVGGAVLLVPRISEALGSQDDGVARDAPVRDDAGLDLDAVRTYPDLPRDHVTGPVAYPEVPPAGGPHWRQWLACGTYDVPVRDENAVASLERGAVWITHRPSLGEADVATLASLLPADGILSPHPGLRVPAAVTVWGVQLKLTGGDDRRLPEFLRVYGDGRTAPEEGGCEGGLVDPEGDPS